MALLLLIQGGKGSKYVNFDSEDVMSSLIWTHLRLMHPNIILREIINESVGFEIISDDELCHDSVIFEFWKKLSPPSMRSTRGRMDYGNSFPEFEFQNPLPKEGDTEADVFLHLKNKKIGAKINTAILFEMKLHSPVSYRTSHDSNRNQCERNYDVLSNYMKRFEIDRAVFILWDNKSSPDTFLLRTKAQHAGEKISVGWISYSKVYEIIKKKLAINLSHTEKAILSDLKAIMEQIHLRSRHQATPFNLNDLGASYERRD